jgi:hypothetical protein
VRNLLRGIAICFFLPIAEFFVRLAGFSVEKARRYFIRKNNEMVMSSGLRCPADKVLVLLPHCLQFSGCSHRLTYNPDNCERCGKCPHAALLDLRDAWGVKLAVATGGTVARRIVAESGLDLIIAAACERDLASGIQDAYPLPVFGIPNTRPHGPCLDTLVDVHEVEWALRLFIRQN